MTALRIGELAKKTNIKAETLRYYERLGLIPEPDRTESGYRQYPPEVINHLSFIKRMQELDFTLKEIKKLLSIVDGGNADSRDIYQFTVEKLHEVEQKMKDLAKVKTMLTDLQNRCPKGGDIRCCPIIETVID